MVTITRPLTRHGGSIHELMGELFNSAGRAIAVSPEAAQHAVSMGAGPQRNAAGVEVAFPQAQQAAHSMVNQVEAHGPKAAFERWKQLSGSLAPSHSMNTGSAVPALNAGAAARQTARILDTVRGLGFQAKVFQGSLGK